jgi:hypothetical protein
MDAEGEGESRADSDYASDSAEWRRMHGEEDAETGDGYGGRDQNDKLLSSILR